ncbi:MAG TPA: peptidase U32 family protein [Hyphomicrobiales bacterium]|nr:U32 family peptidase [Rhodobiaceae bacterium]HXK53603.1 peptidase U32 family protein [Hyphomicrobiales bacterium]
MGASKLELVCPAGTPAALKAAIEAGADAVYLGLRDETNARNFPGLNFSPAEYAEAIRFAHERGVKVLHAINTYPEAGNMAPWRAAVDLAAREGADAVIIADMGLADYVAQSHPDLRLHLSVQASASTADAILYYIEQFGVKRVVLPRVLSVSEIAALNREIPCESEVFVFGGLCVMAEGRCSLSSYATAKSPNMNGVCSPPSHAKYERNGEELLSQLGDYTINRFDAGEDAGYPTLCKGRFKVGGETSYVFEEPTSLNALEHLPALIEAGVTALKIEGRQRGRAYIAGVVSQIRAAVDAAENGGSADTSGLRALSEGGRQTAGAYQKKWR